MIAFPNLENCLSWIIQRLNLSGVKGSDWQKLYEISFPTKNNVPIFDEGDLRNDGNSSSICSNFRNIFQKEEQRDFDDNAKKKSRETETERWAKRRGKNDGDELIEEANDTPIQMFSSSEVKQRLQPQDTRVYTYFLI